PPRGAFVGRAHPDNVMEPPVAVARGPIRTKRSERTRGALLQAARTVFSRTGFHEARITDIVEGANLAHGTFYTHFDSKEDIFLAVLHEVMAGYFTPTGAEPL